MEDFLKINWNPPTSDVVDDEFINESRLESTSVLYRTIHGTFSDPMKNIHTKYMKDVTKKDLMDFKAMKVKQNVEKKLQQRKQTGEEDSVEQEMDFKKKSRTYIPGLSKKIDIKFPRASSLTAEQHALGVRVYTNVSAMKEQELRTYVNLSNLIAEEQKIYLDLCKQHWNPLNIRLIREDLINNKWNIKLKVARQLHRHYLEVGNIPFTSELPIGTNFVSTVVDVENLPVLVLPNPERRYIFDSQSKVIDAKYFKNKRPHAVFLADIDSNFEHLVQEHDVDLVITQSGLHCLASNIDPSYLNNWILPVEIKEINNKNVVFVGKPLPPTMKNILQKNSWIAKYILKSFFLIPDNPSINSQDHFVESRPPNYSDRDTAVGDSDQSWCDYQYNIYEIGSGGCPQNELMKSKIQKDYKMLVRTKVDGIEKSRTGETNRIKLAPKLEYQLALGAEAVTIEEAARQWISLAFTPDTTLLRVRIASQNLEYNQLESRSTTSINNELNRLYNVKGEDSYPIIYNIADNMTKMPPGRYVLRHTARNGAFVNIYKETEKPGKNTIDLEAVFCEDDFQTISNPPWPLIDNKLLTPALVYYKRMPAMFFPSKLTQKPQQKKNLRNRMKKNDV